MASVLEAMPEHIQRPRGSVWAKFSDGQIWKLTLKEDVPQDNMNGARASACNFAAYRRMKLTFRKMDATTFAVQFTPTPAP